MSHRERGKDGPGEPSNQNRKCGRVFSRSAHLNIQLPKVSPDNNGLKAEAALAWFSIQTHIALCLLLGQICLFALSHVRSQTQTLPNLRRIFDVSFLLSCLSCLCGMSIKKNNSIGISRLLQCSVALASRIYFSQRYTILTRHNHLISQYRYHCPWTRPSQMAW